LAALKHYRKIIDLPDAVGKCVTNHSKKQPKKDQATIVCALVGGGEFVSIYDSVQKTLQKLL